MPSCDSGITPVNDLGARPEPRPAAPTVTEAIERYRPYRTEPEDWARMGAFVRACAIDLCPRDVPRAREWMRTLIPFVLCCERDGFGLDRERMFTPDNIDRYIEYGASNLGVQSRATRRSALRRMARQLTTTAPWPPRPEVLEHRPRHPPYTAAEVDGLWHLTQPTPTLQRRLHVTLALGLGAGLWAREYYTCTTEDLLFDHGVMCLHVPGSKARVVPVRDAYAATLRRVVEEDPGSLFLGCPMPTSDRSRLWHLLRDIKVPARLPRLETERLRSTWLVHHLDNRMPLPTLLEAAGLKSTKACTLLLPYLARPDQDTAARLLADRDT